MPSLKQHRLRRVWTIRTLAQESGAAVQSIVNIEAGKPVRLATMRKIASALEVDPWEIDEFAILLEEMGQDQMEKAAA